MMNDVKLSFLPKWVVERKKSRTRRPKPMKKRKGMTLVEVIVAVLLLGLCVMVMTTLTGAKVDQTASLESVYSVQAVDAFFYNVYTDFHNCSTFSISNTPSGGWTLFFDMGDGKRSLYEYSASEKAVYAEGSQVFKCSAMQIRGGGNSLYISIRLPSEKALELDIFK